VGGVVLHRETYRFQPSLITCGSAKRGGVQSASVDARPERVQQPLINVNVSLHGVASVMVLGGTAGVSGTTSSLRDRYRGARAVIIIITSNGRDAMLYGCFET
jgi:hypothetical protein